MKQIFNNVAHSSSHKLEPTAMQILFDIMLMSFKYQVQQLLQPEEIYFVTKKHLRTIKGFVTGEMSISHINVIETKFDKMVQEYQAFDY